MIRYGSPPRARVPGSSSAGAARAARVALVARWPAGGAAVPYGAAASYGVAASGDGGAAAPPEPVFTGLFAMHVPPGFRSEVYRGQASRPAPPPEVDLPAPGAPSPNTRSDGFIGVNGISSHGIAPGIVPVGRSGGSPRRWGGRPGICQRLYTAPTTVI